MQLEKKLIVCAVGAALALSLPAANATHNRLFPYVVKDTNRTTIITVIGNGQPTNAGAALHLQYWTKSTTDANTAACQPNSTTMTFTDNDIATWDTAGLLGAGALFGDTTNSAPLGSSISYAAPRHGYLVVSWLTSGSYAGYWLELDLANGGAHGDIGYNYGATFSSAVALYENTARAVPFWPSSVASSAFTVTPLRPTTDQMDTSDNTSVVMQVRNSAGVQGAYDRNENGVDGTVPQTVRCVGRLTAAQLMPGVVANAAWAATGGWGFLVNLGDGDSTTGELCASGTGDCMAAVYQVDTSNAAGAGKFMQNATRIATDDGSF
jgi:hypothetical protein